MRLKFFSGFLLIFTFSCSSNSHQTQTGEGSKNYYQPQQQPYYYQQQTYGRQYHQPPQARWHGEVPASRYYSNPYDIPPTPYRGSYYYDSDQYYVPPAGYGATEQPQPGQPGFFKNSGSSAF